MYKKEFLMKLREGLAGLPEEDIEEHLAFYGEMIDDRKEDGIPEEIAVGEMGPIYELVSEVISDIPVTKLVKERIMPRGRLKAWDVVLIVLGSPVWLPLLIAALALTFSLYAVLWSAAVALWAVFAAVAACGLAGVAAGVYFSVRGNVLTGIAVTGAGIFCAGLSIFAFFGCKEATRGILKLTKRLAVGLKYCIVKKEEA